MLGMQIYMVRRNNNKNKIHTDSFLKYFTLEVHGMDLSDKYIEDLLIVWNKINEPNKLQNAIETEIHKLRMESKLEYFFYKMKTKYYDELYIEKIIVFVQTVSRCSENYIDYIKVNRKNDEFYLALSLVINLINDKLPPEEIQDVIIDILEQSCNLYGIHLLDRIRKTPDGRCHRIYDSIDIEHLKNVVSQKLHSYYVENKRNIFKDKDWQYILYQWGTNWGNYEGKNKKAVNKYVFSLLKPDPFSLCEFLGNFKQYSGGDTYTYSFEKYSKIYILEDYYQLAQGYKDNETYTQEQRKIVYDFIEAYDTKKEEDKKKAILKSDMISAVVKEGLFLSENMKENYEINDYIFDAKAIGPGYKYYLRVSLNDEKNTIQQSLIDLVKHMTAESRSIFITKYDKGQLTNRNNFNTKILQFDDETGKFVNKREIYDWINSELSFIETELISMAYKADQRIHVIKIDSVPSGLVQIGETNFQFEGDINKTKEYSDAVGELLRKGYVNKEGGKVLLLSSKGVELAKRLDKVGMDID
jgi:hypothetical protein